MYTLSLNFMETLFNINNILNTCIASKNASSASRYNIVCTDGAMTISECGQDATAQHSTAQHSTAQHSTAQHSTAHFYYVDFLKKVKHFSAKILNFHKVIRGT